MASKRFRHSVLSPLPLPISQYLNDAPPTPSCRFNNLPMNQPFVSQQWSNKDENGRWRGSFYGTWDPGSYALCMCDPTLKAKEMEILGTCNAGTAIANAPYTPQIPLCSRPSRARSR